MTEAKEAAKKLRAFAKTEGAQDSKDIRKLAKMVEEGENKKALKFMKSLDTFVREGIPKEAWKYIYLNQTKTRQIVPFIVRIKGCKAQIGDPNEFKLGEIFKAEYEFPGDATEHEIGRSIVNAEADLIKDLIEIEYIEIKKERKK